MLLLSYLLYIKLIFLYIAVLSDVLRTIPQYFSSKNIIQTPVILISRITIVSGHMIKSFIARLFIARSFIAWL